PEDTDIPGGVLDRLWSHTAGWSPHQTHRFATRLADLGLVQDYRLDPPRLRLHDVIRAYLIPPPRPPPPPPPPAPPPPRRPPTRPPPAWRARPAPALSLRAWPGPHLHAAGRDGELAACLHDGRYLAAKLAQTSPASLETELAYLTDPVSRRLH